MVGATQVRVRGTAALMAAMTYNFQMSVMVSLVTLKKRFQKLPRILDQMAFEKTSKPVRVPNMVASILFGISLAKVIWVGMACITAWRAVVVSSVRQRYRNTFFGLTHSAASKN